MNDTPAPDSPSDAVPSRIDTAVVRDLAQILKETELTTIEVEQGGLRIRVAREVAVQAAAPAYAAASATPPTGPQAPAAAASAAAPSRPSGDEVKSPMVGTVYLQPQPGAAAFIKIGDTVSEGQTLLLIEAMKTMNPIAAPRAGVVKALLVGDAQPVEYGEPLVVLE